MNTFKRKSLYSALAGLGALGAAGAAQAVNVNPDGLGQALIYPYYTTRADANGNTYTSLLTVVNSTASAKAVKVRFLEGKNSREVLDFNLFLSAHDVWTAAIVPSTRTAGAMVATTDHSCTLPALPGVSGQDFVNYAYSGGTTDDAGGGSLDRTREGYVEIIEMGHIRDGSTTAVGVTHVGGPNGTPPNCPVSDAGPKAETSYATGGLFGGISLINVGSGADYTEDAVALDNFYTPGDGFYANAGDTTPDLTTAFPVSTVFGTNGTIVQSFWGIGQGQDAVSAVLMHNNVMNEFFVDPAVRGGTDWVVTMPTKRHYVSVGTGSAGRLFQRNFNATAGSCDDVSLDLWDREEFSKQGGFSPAPPGAINRICWEANVITFNGTSVFASNNVANVPTSFLAGWMRMGFFPSVSTIGNKHRLVAPAGNSTIIDTSGVPAVDTVGVTYFGLPVVGFAAQAVSNNNMVVGGATVLSNYGGNFVHKYNTLQCLDAVTGINGSSGCTP